MSEDMPEDMADRVSEDMPEHMPDDMPGRMPVDMPDRMPEDMPRRVGKMTLRQSDEKPLFCQLVPDPLHFYSNRSSGKKPKSQFTSLLKHLTKGKKARAYKVLTHLEAPTKRHSVRCTLIGPDGQLIKLINQRGHGSQYVMPSAYKNAPKQAQSDTILGHPR
jgi:hypothetical protein